MQRVKVAVDSFAFGASVTSLEGLESHEKTQGKGTKFEPKAGKRQRQPKGRVARRKSALNRASVLFLVMEYGTVRAPLRRALQRDTSQHGILGVKAPLLASAACKVAPLVASPGLQDLVLIDRAQFPKSDGPKLRLSDGSSAKAGLTCRDCRLWEWPEHSIQSSGSHGSQASMQQAGSCSHRTCGAFDLGWCRVHT